MRRQSGEDMGSHHQKSEHKPVEKEVPRVRGTWCRCQSSRAERKLSAVMGEALAAVMEDVYKWGDIDIYSYINIKNDGSPVCHCQRRTLQTGKGRKTK